MKWRDILRRASLLLGLISLVLAIWAGTHFQHLLDNEGSKHAGETLVAVLLTLLVFAGSWYGSAPPRRRDAPASTRDCPVLEASYGRLKDG